MESTKKRSVIIKKIKDNSNVPNNTYNHGIIDEEDNRTDYFTAEKTTPYFSELFQGTTDVNEAINKTDEGTINSVISEMSNMGLKLDSTGKS